MQIKISNILVYYDTPQIFIAVDDILTKFLCMAVDVDTYVVMPISTEKLHKVTSGKLDLRTAFEDSEVKYWFEGNLINLDVLEYDEKVTINQIDDAYLPDEGCYLTFNSTEEDEALLLNFEEKQSTLMEIAISDQDDNTSISVNALGDFLESFQSVVHNAYRKIVSKSNPMEKNIIGDTNFSTLRAFAVSPGSFKVHIEIASMPSIGPSTIELALQNLDSLFTEELDESQLIGEFRKNKGHTLNSVKKFLDTIKDNNIQFRYKWIGIGERQIRQRKLNRERILYLSDLLGSKADLTTVIREFTGIVQAADVKGDWRILNTEDETEYKGKFEGGFSESIEVEGKLYKFICEEIIEGYKVSEKEKITYRLISYESIE